MDRWIYRQMDQDKCEQLVIFHVQFISSGLKCVRRRKLRRAPHKPLPPVLSWWGGTRLLSHVCALMMINVWLSNKCCCVCGLGSAKLHFTRASAHIICDIYMNEVQIFSHKVPQLDHSLFSFLSPISHNLVLWVTRIS